MKFLPVLLLSAVLSACGAREGRYAQLNDADLATAVKARFAAEGLTSPLSGVSVSVAGGVVTLSGIVDSSDSAGRAELVARQVPQVERVINNLQVIPTFGMPAASPGASSDPSFAAPGDLR